MIKAVFSAPTPDTPILVMTNRYEIRIDIKEAESLIEDLEHAVETAKALQCPRTRREMVYGPGTTPTFIPQQINVTIPNVEIKTQGTQRTEQPYKINSKKSDMEQEFI